MNFTISKNEQDVLLNAFTELTSTLFSSFGQIMIPEFISIRSKLEDKLIPLDFSNIEFLLIRLSLQKKFGFLMETLPTEYTGLKENIVNISHRLHQDNHDINPELTIKLTPQQQRIMVVIGENNIHGGHYGNESVVIPEEDMMLKILKSATFGLFKINRHRLDTLFIWMENEYGTSFNGLSEYENDLLKHLEFYRELFRLLSEKAAII